MAFVFIVRCIFPYFSDQQIRPECNQPLSLVAEVESTQPEGENNSQTRPFVEARKNEAIALVQEHAHDLQSFIHHVLDNPLGVGYNLNSRRLSDNFRLDYQKLKKRELILRNRLYSAIENNPYLCFMSPWYNENALFVTRWKPDKKSLQEWRRKDRGEALGAPPRSWQFGDIVETQDHIWASQNTSRLELTLPVFYNSRFVCFLLFSYCIPQPS